MAGARFTLRLDAWPARDHALWQEGLRKRGPFDSPYADARLAYASGLAAASIRKALKSHGRWLGFLRDRGMLDAAAHPLDRVTLPRLGQYFEALRAAGNADHTIVGYFAGLRSALRILAPERDSSFVSKPNGTTIRSLLPMRKRQFAVPDASVLFAWSLELIEAAQRTADPYAAAILLRDGLLIAIFASRARRLRAMAGLRLGRELRREGERYVVDLPLELVKTRKRDRFLLPAALDEPMRAYLDIARPGLLQGKIHDAIWVGSSGDPLTARGITAVVERRSRERFGITFRPHRFRHAIGTTLPLKLPEHPGLAAAFLGGSRGVIQESYNRSGQAAATAMFLEQREREQAAAVEDHARRQRLRASRFTPVNPPPSAGD
jgi:hypothetical protein